MRYFLSGILVFFTAYTWAENYDEAIAAISFNPSRTGAYKYLKVAKKAKLTGIDASNNTAQVSIASKGVVEVNPTVCTGCTNLFEIQDILPVAKDADCSTYSKQCSDAKTQLEAGLYSFVRGSKQAGSSITEIPENFTGIEGIESLYENDGTEVNVYPGATLTSTGQTFIGQLTGTLPEGTGKLPIHITLERPSADGGSLKLKATVKVTDSVTLGGVTIKKSVLPDGYKFKWDSVEGSSKLYRLIVSH